MKIFNKETLDTAVAISVWVIIFTSIKILMSPGNSRHLREILISFFVAIPVGMLSGMTAFEWGMGTFTSCLIASVATLLSEQIILTIINNDINFSEFIKKIFNNLIEKWTK